MNTFLFILVMICLVVLGFLQGCKFADNENKQKYQEGYLAGKEDVIKAIEEGYWIIKREDYQHQQNLQMLLEQLEDLFEDTDDEVILDGGEY